MKNTMMTLVEMIDNALFAFTGFVLLNFDKIILSIVALIGIYSFCTQ
jgi:hypothetical protein